MRSSLIRAVVLLSATAAPALAAGGDAPARGLLDPAGGLMFWTVLVFGTTFFILSKFAFKPILSAVEGREQALRDAMDEAKADRELAAQLLAEQKQQLDAARTDAQKIIADGRATAEKMRNDLLEQTRTQQHDMLERAKRDIEAEKQGAIAELRREAVDLAIAGAGKVIEKNLDDAANRALVDKYLSSIGTK
ncbi:MAG: F0F1 ATP synthase subunit B [Gemmatimonadetes bacterium]|nr:F0F1 ATP synthase subunit B [Gemmatimonadota bacterium]